MTGKGNTHFAQKRIGHCLVAHDFQHQMVFKHDLVLFDECGQTVPANSRITKLIMANVSVKLFSNILPQAIIITFPQFSVLQQPHNRKHIGKEEKPVPGPPQSC